MFGDSKIVEEMAAALLDMYPLEDLLEMNNITDTEALTILIEGGYIGEPSRIIAELEGQEGGSEEA